MPRLKPLLLISCAVVFFQAGLRADTYTIGVPDYTSRGWYNNAGVNSNEQSIDGNYLAGFYAGNQYNDYFVFDLSNIPAGQTISAVTLAIFDTGNSFSNPNATPDYQLYSIDSTSVAALQGASTNTAANISVFNDLGSGTAYSAGTPIGAADEGMTLDISLNEAFVSYAQANLGGYVALGGSLATTGTGNTSVFGLSQDYPFANTALVITTVPEPTPLTLAIACFFLIVIVRVRRLV